MTSNEGIFLMTIIEIAKELGVGYRNLQTKVVILGIDVRDTGYLLSDDEVEIIRKIINGGVKLYHLAEQ